MKKNNFYFLFFFLVLAFPFCLYCLLAGRSEGELITSENRTITQFPTFTIKKSKIKNFFKQFDLYISDRLIGKERVTQSVNKLLKDPFFFTSFDLSKGIIGKNGYVFLGNDYKEVLQRHFGRYNINLDRLKTFQNIVNSLKSEFQKYHTNFVVLVAPDKHVVYSQFVPNWIGGGNKHSTQAVTRQILKQFDGTGIKFLYPANLLIEHSIDAQMYYKTDTHWNKKGAEIAFKDLMESFGLSHFLHKEHYKLKLEQREKIGDLKAIVGLTDGFGYIEDDYDFKPNKKIKISWQTKDQQKTYIDVQNTIAHGERPNFEAFSTNPEAILKARLLVICDSFGSALTPFLSTYFSDVIYVSRHSSVEHLKKIIEEFRPNYCVYEIVEREL